MSKTPKEPRSSAAHDRKQRTLTQPAPARVGGIAEAVVIKDAELAFLCERDGCVPGSSGHGLGLYYRDCRFLSRYELRLAGAVPESLAASSGEGFRSVFQLTNPELECEGSRLGRQIIGVRWRHVIDAGDLALRDELVVQNFHREQHTIPLSLCFGADFADVFAIRGMIEERQGELHPVRWDGEGLVFAYDGGDGRERRLVVRFSEPPAHVEGAEVGFELTLAPHEEKRLVISLAVLERGAHERLPAPRSGRQAVADAEDAFERSISAWLEGFTRVTSDNQAFDRVLGRSLRDLRALRMSLEGSRFFAAGVPWFMALFGRDSLLCALQTLAFRPEIATDTLRLLAKFQGKRVDRFCDEEPGKILHELRTGELANMGMIPHTPYYGTVDATPLFLILLAQHSRWTGSLELFHELRANVDAALEWMGHFGDEDGDGYLEYSSAATGNGGLANQGWKDSGDAIVTADGGLAESPIALVEVQGYAYRAKLGIAELLERDGDASRAQELRRAANTLRDRFNRDYWIESEHFLALALHGPQRARAEVISSNAGQALWAGIVSDEHAANIVAGLMAQEMYSGWGIRTLSSRERAYNPVGYHLGTIWPHDNALIAAGMRRYGYDSEACRVFGDLFRAATFFEHARLPELFAGFQRGPSDVPAHYPVACHPQAWAAGAMPFLLEQLLGLSPDGFAKRLSLVRPRLPDFIQHLRLNRLRVGGAEVDLLFERAGESLSVKVEHLRGELDVVVHVA